jgi:hypothetical protein
VQRVPVGAKHLIQRLSEVLQQVKAVGHLGGLQSYATASSDTRSVKMQRWQVEFRHTNLRELDMDGVRVPGPIGKVALIATLD